MLEIAHQTFDLTTTRVTWTTTTAPGTCQLRPQRAIQDAAELSPAERSRFLQELACLGRAVTAVYRPHRVRYQVSAQPDRGIVAWVLPEYAIAG